MTERLLGKTYRFPHYDVYDGFISLKRELFIITNGFGSVKDRTATKGVFQISFCPRVLEYIFISDLDHYCSEP